MDIDTEQRLRAELEAVRERLEWAEKELDRDKPVPLSEQVWDSVGDADDENWRIYHKGDWIATAHDEATRDIILAIPKLVKACTKWPTNGMTAPEAVQAALRKMGVVE